MKNIWKWALGIVIVLVILSAPLLLHYTLGDNFVRGFDGRGPMMGGRGWDHDGFGRGLRGPIGMHGGFGFFGPFVFLGGLVKLAFFGALLYGAYWLGKRNARIVLEPAPVASAPVRDSASTAREERDVSKSE